MGSKGSILIAGSPVYFPNYKIPFLAQEIGFHIAGCADYTNLKALLKSVPQESERLSFRTLLKARYQADCSPAYPNNDVYVRAVCQIVIYHKE